MTTKPVTTLVLNTFAMIVVIIMIFSWLKLSPTKVKLPLIQGVILTKAHPLKPFYLQSLHGNIFTKEQLQGHWSIISYGYTHCPDICPTTLMTLTALLEQFIEREQQGKLQGIFYSVDAQRDSSEILRNYVGYFSSDIMPLRAADKHAAKRFEQQLGIQVSHNVNSSSNTYQVAHSVSMLLINPNGALQAVLFPEVSDLGIENFAEQQLLTDFLSVKHYFESQQLMKKSQLLSF